VGKGLKKEVGSFWDTGIKKKEVRGRGVHAAKRERDSERGNSTKTPSPPTPQIFGGKGNLEGVWEPGVSVSSNHKVGTGKARGFPSFRLDEQEMASWDLPQN